MCVCMCVCVCVMQSQPKVDILAFSINSQFNREHRRQKQTAKSFQTSFSGNKNNFRFF
jgi:hypothetical protein